MNHQKAQVIQQDGVYLGINEVTQAEWHKVMGHSDYKIHKGPKVHGLQLRIISSTLGNLGYGSRVHSEIK